MLFSCSFALKRRIPDLRIAKQNETVYEHKFIFPAAFSPQSAPDLPPKTTQPWIVGFG